MKLVGMSEIVDISTKPIPANRSCLQATEKEFRVATKASMDEADKTMIKPKATKNRVMPTRR